MAKKLHFTAIIYRFNNARNLQFGPYLIRIPNFFYNNKAAVSYSYLIAMLVKKYFSYIINHKIYMYIHI